MYITKTSVARRHRAKTTVMAVKTVMETEVVRGRRGPIINLFCG